MTDLGGSGGVGEDGEQQSHGSLFVILGTSTNLVAGEGRRWRQGCVCVWGGGRGGGDGGKDVCVRGGEGGRKDGEVKRRVRGNKRIGEHC